MNTWRHAVTVKCQRPVLLSSLWEAAHRVGLSGRQHMLLLLLLLLLLMMNDDDDDVTSQTPGADPQHPGADE